MFRSFTDDPSFAPYTFETPKIALDTPNPPNAPLAGESSRMDFSKEDQAPMDLLNRAIWASVKGAAVPMPAPKSATKDDDD